MSGRFALFSSPARIRNHFATSDELMLKPRFNIAPAQSVPVIKADAAGRRVIMLARWGLIPSWVEDPEEMQQPINAKAETAAIKPMYRHAYRTSRVLIPADAFYEWSPRDGKQPFLIKLKDNEPMGLGGLLECWHGYDTEIMTFTILTTHANLLMADFYDRMPVIIKPEDYTAWLDTGLTDILKIQAMAHPYPERLMEAYPISRNINNPLHDSPDVIVPIREADKTGVRSITAGLHRYRSRKVNRLQMPR
jgi:putative SOS response-associated peptidase YedK